jgi:hypothetical protein
MNAPWPGHIGRTCLLLLSAFFVCSQPHTVTSYSTEAVARRAMIGYVIALLQLSILRGMDPQRTLKNVPPSYTECPRLLRAIAPPSAFARLAMFSRSVPRAARRIRAFAQCEAQPSALRYTPIQPKTWRPVQQQLSRRHASSLRQQFREQFRKSPIFFPFAIGA